MERIPERRESLWLLVTSPTVWAVHFLLCYATAAIWCAKLGGPAVTPAWLKLLLVGYTLLALAGIGANGWFAYRRHLFGRATLPHDFATDADRHRFLGFATLLLSGLSAVAVLYVGLAAALAGGCQ